MDAKTIQRYDKRKLSWLIAKAQFYFNAYIRARDKDDDYFTCISCGATKRIENYANGSNYHAGHYYPSTYSSLRFNDKNVNGQCGQCNTHKHGNPIEYRKGLVKKYGIQEVEHLDNEVLRYNRNGFKWDRFSLIEIIEDYKQKIKYV